MPALGVALPLEEIAAVAKRHHVATLAVFGSVLRADFRPSSDIDILVEFAPGRRISLSDIGDLADELAAVVGRKVDVVERQALHWYIRDEVLADARMVYAS